MNVVFVNPDFYDHDAELLEEHYKLKFSPLPMSKKLLELFETATSSDLRPPNLLTYGEMAVERDRIAHSLTQQLPKRR